MSKKKTKGGATPALRVLESAGVDHSTHEYDSEGTDFGAEAAEVMAERLGAGSERIFKTLVVSLAGAKGHAGAQHRGASRGAGNVLAVAMVPVDTHLDLKAVAVALGYSKAAMADKAEAQRVTGYVLGGVSPLGQKKALPTVIDEAAWDAAAAGQTIFFSGGKRGLEIELDPAELVRILGARRATIAAR